MNRASVFDSATIPQILVAASLPAPSDRGLVRCFFHEDRSPSLRIFEQGFRCFGCGAHGGVADFLIGLGLADDRATAARWLEENVR